MKHRIHPKFGKNRLWSIVVFILLAVASCGKTGEEPDPVPDPPQPSDISRLAGVVFPKEGASSTLNAFFYPDKGLPSESLSFTPKNNIANSSNILTPGQKVYFKNLDSTTPLMCISGGTITASAPGSDKTATFPVLSPILGNRDIEMPVDIKFDNTTNPTQWVIKGKYECDIFTLEATGKVSSKLNNLKLFFYYHLKNAQLPTSESSQTWYTLFGSEDANSTASLSPFKFEGIDQLFPSITNYSSDDVIQAVLNAKAISPVNLGFSKENSEYLSIAQIYQMICYGIKDFGFGQDGGYVNPYYWFYNERRIDNTTGAYFVMPMPFYSFERFAISDKGMKVFLNLSSILNMKLVNHTWMERGGLEGVEYYPLNTNLYNGLQYNIANAFGDKAASGIELSIQTEDSSDGKIKINTINDSDISRSLLTALLSIYTADSGNLARLRNALSPTFKDDTQKIVSVVSNINNEIGKCRDLKFGFRYNNYWTVNDTNLAIYKCAWGNIGLIFDWH